MQQRPASAQVGALWHALAPSGAEIRRARRRLHGKALALVALIAASYGVVVVSDVSMALRLPGALALVAGLVALATNVMHDANHGSFSRRRWVNRTLACTSDALGASSWLWRIQHNQLHHGNTNVVGFDADLELSPFARLAPAQTWHRWYRAQHVYIWPLYGFLALKNLLVSDFVAVITGRLGRQPLPARRTLPAIAGVALGKLGHITWALLIPLCFQPWWAVAAFYVACSWLVGFTLAIVFQLAHCVEATSMQNDRAPRRGHDFAAHQLRTTANIATPAPIGGPIFRWLAGGLDHQIEHHLAPRLPHTLYPELGSRFRTSCEANGIPYHCHPGVWNALCSHGRWLRAMSRPPEPDIAAVGIATTHSSGRSPGARASSPGVGDHVRSRKLSVRFGVPPGTPARRSRR